MYWRTNIFILAMLVLGCKTERKDRVIAVSEGSLIETHELNAHLENPDLKIIDIRNVEAFSKGHLPGALQISRKDMEYTGDTLPGMRAGASQMAELLSKKGIEEGNWVVLYDDRGNAEAARLWCILKGYGMNRIKLLNGGLKAWEADGYATESAIQETAPSAFRWEGDPEPLWIDAEDIVRRIGDTGTGFVLIDTRTPEEYHGVRQKKNAARAGHIPGALHLDWADLIDYHGDHRIKQKDKIRSELAKFGLSNSDTIVLYCHSGVRSSLSTFVLRELMGYHHVWNYDGSWTEWSRIMDYSIEVDSITTLFN